MEAPSKNHVPKIIALAVLILAAVLFFSFDLQQYLSLDYIKSRQADFNQYYQEHQWLMIGAFFGVYVVTTAFSFPGAAVLTIAAGAFFGLVTGTIVVSFASSIGATLAMLIARTLLRDYFQARFAKQIKRINDGIEKEGAYYLFTLRLVPAVPFFVINVGMGITPMRTVTFYWVSQLGMLPGTAVYVNAGSQLAQIESVGDIASPSLLASFALLGIFPLAVKKIMGFVNKKKGADLPVPKE